NGPSAMTKTANLKYLQMALKWFSNPTEVHFHNYGYWICMAVKQRKSPITNIGLQIHIAPMIVPPYYLPHHWKMIKVKTIKNNKHVATYPDWINSSSTILFSTLVENDADVDNQNEQTKEEKDKEQTEKSEKSVVINRLKYKSDAAGFLDDTYSQIVSYDVES